MKIIHISYIKVKSLVRVLLVLKGMSRTVNMNFRRKKQKPLISQEFLKYTNDPFGQKHCRIAFLGAVAMLCVSSHL